MISSPVILALLASAGFAKALFNCTVNNVASFSLIAHYRSTGEQVPLVVGGGGNPNATEGQLATNSSVTFSLGDTFNMTANEISTNGVGNGTEGAPVSKWGITVLQGEFLAFARLVDGSGAEPAPIYCLVPSTAPTPYSMLAVNDDTASFSVCHDTDPAHSTQYSVVWQARENRSDIYDYSTCEEVDVFIVQS